MASTSAAGFTLVGDQPWEPSSLRDPLGFSDQADDLARVISESRRRSPFTLGINGAWGSGKSSLMRCLEAALCRHDLVQTVRFNAWSAERGDVAEGLVKTVLQRVAPRRLAYAAVKAGTLRALQAFVLLAASRIGLASIVDAIWSKAKDDDAARNRLSEMLAGALRREFDKGGVVVVFVDDLDRIAPDAVLRTFEAIKIYLDAPGLVFVVALDPEIVSDALLAQKHYGSNVTAERYLEKIIQIAHRVSIPDDAQVHDLLDSYAKDSGLDSLLDHNLRTIVAGESARNPRKMKRFINAAVLSLRIDDQNTLDVRSHLSVSALELYFPEFARLVVDQPTVLEEFLTYVRLRQVGIDAGDPSVRAFLQEHGMSTGSDVTLADVEADLPESFPSLARNERFVTIVRDLLAASAPRDVGAGLENVVIPEHEARDAGVTEIPLKADGLRILWVDDSPESNEALVQRIRRGGGFVVQADSASMTEQLLSTSAATFDLLVSDIARGVDQDAGFSDLRRWQDEELWSGPVVFFAARITPERRSKATELEAFITSSPSELMLQVAAIAAKPRRTAATR